MLEQGRHVRELPTDVDIGGKPVGIRRVSTLRVELEVGEASAVCRQEREVDVPVIVDEREGCQVGQP